MARGHDTATPDRAPTAEQANETPTDPMGMSEELATPMPPPPLSLTGEADFAEHELATMISAGHSPEDCRKRFQGSLEIWTYVAALSAQQRSALLNPAFPLRLQLYRSQLAAQGAYINPVRISTPATAAPHMPAGGNNDGAASQHTFAHLLSPPALRTSLRPTFSMDQAPRSTPLSAHPHGFTPDEVMIKPYRRS